MTALTSAPRRSRTMKAVAAGALGVALLAGGGGTFANWYENTTIASGQVSAGHLDWNVAAPTWTDQNGKAIDPASFRMVPGDTVTYTTTVTTDLVGDNLKAVLKLDDTSLQGTLAPYVRSTTAITQNGAAISNPLTPASNGTYDVKVTLTLPFSTADANGTDAEKTTLDLTSVKLSLTQVQ